MRPAEERTLERRRIWTALKWLRGHYDVHSTASDVQVVCRAKFGAQPSADVVRRELRKALEAGWIIGWAKAVNPYKTSRFDGAPGSADNQVVETQP